MLRRGFLLAVSIAAAQSPVSGQVIEFVRAPIELPASLRDSIRFGYLHVPQDHDLPNGRRLRLALAVLSARTNSPAPDPIVFVPGGPGMSVMEPWLVEAARSPRIALFRAHREFILLEPRGHGLSEPRPCPELDGAAPLVDDSPEAEAILAAKFDTCRRRWTTDGMRPELLNSVQAARDIELLRRALGAPRVNLIGGSYGSRIAAEAMRQIPWAIRSAVFIGPVPPGLGHLGDDADTAPAVLRAIVRRCAGRPECRTAYPRLDADLDTLLARIRREPLTVAMARSERLPGGQIRVDEELLQSGLAQLLAGRQLAAAAPLLIHTLAEQGLTALAAMAPQLARLLSDDSDIAFGTNHAFLCNDVPRRIETAPWLPGRCVAWIGDSYGDPAGEPLRSDIPTLVMVGEFDPRTPPSYAGFVLQGLTHGHLVEIPWHGHEYQHPCISRIQRDFFETPQHRPGTACLDSIAPVDFVSGVAYSRWVSNAILRSAEQPVRFGAPVAAATVLLLVSAVGLPAREFRRRHRRSREGFVLWLATVAALALLLGVMVAAFVGANRNPLIPALGVPAGWGWVLALPWLLLVLALVAVALSIRGSERSEPPPITLRLMAFAGVSFVLGLWVFHSVV